MKERILLLFLLFVFGGCDFASQTSPEPLSKLQCDWPPNAEEASLQQIEKSDVVDVMRSVRSFHTVHILEYADRERYNKWIDCAMYTGMMAGYRATGEQAYLDSTQAWAERLDWQLGPRFRHADDHCVGQVYLEVYRERPEVAEIQPTLSRMRQIMANPQPGNVAWDWADALFMAPPVLTRMGAVTETKRPFDFMADQFREASAPLYDPAYGLYYRDKRFLDARSENGKKVFWSRGNGWVLAGIARVLQDLPEDHSSRDWFEERFRSMSKAVACTQQESGFWRPSLLDPQAYPQPETSGTGFFTYALAWGINSGLLSKDIYGPIVSRAWTSMVRESVNEEGRVGWVQQPGDRPAPVEENRAEPYGAGAFLMAGSQVKQRLDSVAVPLSKQE
ncbi:rhamnogalacturonyl hydrolase YesR [Salinibacter ruber]|uniref:glycoside hydrolase family 88/105 protein n=1 Tax=Salinibacter ruber TaxID=146919 RepID=UPI002169326E|nr:glycoside hydrolase family 88 protein [Salinibacter ruber]MCS3938733.1 rhamnogalacturonyl hydrolase YesR [Salinibacter ruber]